MFWNLSLHVDRWSWTHTGVPIFLPLADTVGFVNSSIIRRFRFEAAHELPWHPGKCANLHGHSYVLEVKVSGPLDDRGVVMDFAEVDDAVDPIVALLDHSFLNERIDNPTAERVALWIADSLTRKGLPWSAVRIWETEDGSAIVER